jgi:predicted alpha/beta-fold hydrolase
MSNLIFFTKYNRHRKTLELDKNIDCNAISKAKSLREFDTLFVTKHFGYESCDDYYRDACLDNKIQNIRVPTLFLNAGDDMFSPEKAFPIDVFKSNENIALVWTQYGGHISFCEGIVPHGCNYSCRILTEYLEVVLKEMEN